MYIYIYIYINIYKTSVGNLFTISWSYLGGFPVTLPGATRRFWNAGLQIHGNKAKSQSWNPLFGNASINFKKAEHVQSPPLGTNSRCPLGMLLEAFQEMEEIEIARLEKMARRR